MHLEQTADSDTALTYQIQLLVGLLISSPTLDDLITNCTDKT